jgi:myo-inositol-1(or 4)-monophosphatase
MSKDSWASTELVQAIEARLAIIEGLLPALETELLDLQSKGYQTSTKTNSFDLVTEADLHSEKKIMAAIGQYFPEDGICSEESQTQTHPLATSDSFIWVIDPIDGTVNYANKLHHWGISVGILYNGTPVGGIVSAPALKLQYRAVIGKGATKNGSPIQVNPNKELSQGVVTTGFPYDRAHRAEPLSRALANMLKVAGGVRRLGAAAVDFCMVADGSLIAYYEMQLKPWDMAAGLIIAKEAGAQITDFNNQAVDPFKSHGVVVANPEIHRKLLPLTAPMLEAIAAY